MQLHKEEDSRENQYQSTLTLLIVLKLNIQKDNGGIRYESNYIV